jgi:hypothetical protein
MSMYKIVDCKGNEAVVESGKYNRSEILQLAWEKNPKIDRKTGNFSIFPLKP